MKKALVYNAYLNILGGGERYTLTFALGLLKNSYEVDLAWNDNSILQKAKERFGLDFSKIKINGEAYEECHNGGSIIKRYLFTNKYDLIFWVFSGNIPYLFSKNNLLHLQVPFIDISGNILINNFKNLFINKFIYNSEFTRNVHERHFSRNKSFVLYPPIDTEKFHIGKKEDLIISVGRFGSKPASKRQDIIVDAFKRLCAKVKGYN